MDLGNFPKKGDMEGTRNIVQIPNFSRRREYYSIYGILVFLAYSLTNFSKKANFPKKTIMLVYAKKCNGAEGILLENFTLLFETYNDFANFYCFYPKYLQGCRRPRRVAQ